MVAAIAAFALLLIGEAGLNIFPVGVSIEVHGSDGIVSMDGAEHPVHVPDLGPNARVSLEQPGPAEREFQIDGSDTTTRNDRDPSEFRAIQGAPWYRLLGWLRDESSYSRWQYVRLVDLSDGHVIASGAGAVQNSALPAAFRIEASLERPEAPARIWLQNQNGDRLAGFSVERDNHRAVWLLNGGGDSSNHWFFPQDVWPFAAEIVQLVGRSAAAGMVLLALMAPVGAGIARLRASRPRWISESSAPPLGAVAAVIVAVWFSAVVWVTVRVYHQLPHIVDAQSYYFQALILETGRTWLHMPRLVEMLDGFQQVEWNGRWFSQYPPGAPAMYALGGLLDAAWLVGPLFSLVLVVSTGAAGVLAFNRWVGLVAVALAALSPFLLFQAGSFLSHPIAGGLVAAALALFLLGVRTGRLSLFAIVGVLLGSAFNTREITALLYGAPFAVWLVAQRRWRALGLMALAVVPFLAAYLLYNLSTTEDPLLLPRVLFNPDDRWGFGAVGSSGQHTVAAGLVNTDQNLTLLQFDLFGWPPLATFALIGLPFLLGRAGRFDALLAAIAGGFVVAYVGYFYNGIALGPRYYFEAVPALTLLAARGVQVAVQVLRSAGLRRVEAVGGALVVMLGLSAWTLGYYLPHEVNRRMDYAALSGGRRLVLPFVETTPAGPRLQVSDTPALVIVPNEDVFKSISALNCPVLEDDALNTCPVLLVNARLDQVTDLMRSLADRAVYVVDTQGDLATLDLVARRADRLETAAQCTQSRCSRAAPPD